MPGTVAAPNAWNANNVLIVNAGNGGALDNNNANNSNAVRPIGRTVRNEYRRESSASLARSDLPVSERSKKAEDGSAGTGSLPASLGIFIWNMIISMMRYRMAVVGEH